MGEELSQMSLCEAIKAVRDRGTPKSGGKPPFLTSRHSILEDAIHTSSHHTAVGNQQSAISSQQSARQRAAAVSSRQWAVGSGQWAVGSEQKPRLVKSWARLKRCSATNRAKRNASRTKFLQSFLCLLEVGIELKRFSVGFDCLVI